MFGNVFQIVYFGVRNISCVIGICFFLLFFFKVDNSIVLNEMPHYTDMWERHY